MAREFLEKFESSNEGAQKPDFVENGFEFYTSFDSDSVENFKLMLKEKGFSYISIHAYINPKLENHEKLMELRDKLEEKTKLPVTLDFGPRFLHSTGQLHKGDEGKGFFYSTCK